MLSYPAHTSYPTSMARKADAAATPLGSDATSNKRTIYKYIHADGIKSCQLVMGFTELAAGSVWNTMPAHTHMRRSEVYFYFDMAESARVFHMMERLKRRGTSSSQMNRLSYRRVVDPFGRRDRGVIRSAGAWAEKTRILAIWTGCRWISFDEPVRNDRRASGPVPP